MNKKLLAAAVVAAVAASPAAFADSTVYGKLHTAIQYNDLEVPDGAGGKLDRSNYSVESNASRLGFKGSEDLGNGLKAIYQIEFGISSDGGLAQTNA
ncbi:MAG: porin, partial [Sedimenticolaceae bacterium]